jgi:hypothetical protein
MKKYPKCEVNVTKEPEVEQYKAVAKTQMPCGVTILQVITKEDRVAAELYAKRECIHAGLMHIHEHKCG